MKALRLTIIAVAALQIGACASGVSRSLGKCGEGAERRPVSATRWPGGMAQMNSIDPAEVPGTVAAPDAGQQAPRPAGRTVTVRPSTPPAAPRPAPLVPVTPAPEVPRSIELNPLTPTGASLPPKPSTADCNG